MKYTVAKQFQGDIQFTIGLVLNGGTCSVSSITGVCGEEYDLPTATRSGYYLVGWYTDSGLTNKVTVDTKVDYSIRALYAKWGTMSNYTSFSVTTSSTNNKFGIYTLTKKSDSTSIIIDWGDGETEELTASATNKQHTYSTAGTYTVKVSDDVSLLRVCYSSYDYYRYNQSTLRKVLTWSTSLTSIPQYCFYKCYNLTSIDASFSNISIIESYAFYNCCNLQNWTTKLQQMSKVTSIPSYCFYGCYYSGITSISEACLNNKTSLGTYAFQYCYQLTSVVIPSTVTELGDYCFSGCHSIKSITVNRDNPPTVHTNTFGNQQGTYSRSSYTGYNYSSSGTNTLYVRYPNNYRTSYWLSVLGDSSKCNFRFFSTDSYSAQGFRVSGLESRYTYTGSAITPTPSVINQSGITLTKDTDYTLSYSDNTECGTATITITGIGSYKEYRTVTFKIYDPSLMSIDVDLNSQWQTPTRWTNTNEEFDVYESNSNYHVANGYAKMYIRVSGVTDLEIYINSYAESSFDYTIAFNPDIDVTSDPSNYSSSFAENTCGYQYDPSSYGITSGTGWKKVTYTLDGGEHYILISYRKDGSVDDNFDRGYVAIPIMTPPTTSITYSDGTTVTKDITGEIDKSDL